MHEPFPQRVEAGEAEGILVLHVGEVVVDECRELCIDGIDTREEVSDEHMALVTRVLPDVVLHL